MTARRALSARWEAAIVVFMASAVLGACVARAQTTGLVPINDLGSGTYAGYPGGLYPGGVNTPPAAHLSAALARSGEIVPRDAAGNPDPSGWIAMIAVGMSNTTHEFGAFERDADADTTRNARVILLDTAFGGQTATAIANPTAPYWTTMSQRIAAMGLTAAQVQVAWLKEAEAHPPNNFPLHAQALRDTLKVVVRNLHDKFPNLKLCYLSSRIYGGYSAQGGLNPEPQAYESGFSVKWLIEDQINGDPAINYDPGAGAVRAPLLLWGPYLWADGVNPRSDGLVWLISDLEGDHVHPSPSGEEKVSAMLHAFFAADPTAAAWWPAQSGTRLEVLDAIADAYVSAASPSSNFGAAPELLAQGGTSPISTYVRFDASGETRPIELAKLSARVSTSGVGGGAVRAVASTTWDESSITYDNAPAIGAGLVQMPQSTRDGTIGANVTANVVADADRQVSFALTSTAASPATYVSKEGGQPPRLVLVVATPSTAVGEIPAPTRRLRSVAPNPLLQGARIEFELRHPGPVDLSIFSIDGRRVTTLVHGAYAAGRHFVAWDGRDAAGHKLEPGVYMVRIAARDGSDMMKIVRLQ